MNMKFINMAIYIREVDCIHEPIAFNVGRYFYHLHLSPYRHYIHIMKGRLEECTLKSAKNLILQVEITREKLHVRVEHES